MPRASAGRPLAEHFAAVTSLIRPLPPELLPLEPALGRVLAQPATARLAVPPFSNSAMDGFLVRSADLTGTGPWTLPVIGDVPAGAPPLPLHPGQALRIMTGAPVGESDREQLQVIPVEDTDISPGPGPLPAEVTVWRASPGRAHIRSAGENIRPGQTAVPAGTVLHAGTLATLISVGVTEVTVRPAPTVVVLSSGNELVAPGETLREGQIPDSNRPMLAALAASYGAGRVVQRQAGDTGREFAAALDTAAAEADLVVTSGGVSVGAYDVVRAVTAAPGQDAQMWFGEVAQKPGAPQGLGRWRGTPVISLPGNPVAAFVSFHLYVAPALRILAGHPVPGHVLDRPRVTARRGAEFPAVRGRTVLVPVQLSWDEGPVAHPFHGRHAGSHMVASLAGTDGVAVLRPRAAGGEDTVEVILTPGC